MKFLTNGKMNNSGLLRLILIFTLIYLVIFWAANILIYADKIGFTYGSVVDYYLGSENEFKTPVSYMGLLETAHFHLFTYAMALLFINHLMAFSRLPDVFKFSLIVLSFASGIGNISAGWLVRFASPLFAYFKIGCFIVFQISLFAALVIAFRAVDVYRKI